MRRLTGKMVDKCMMLVYDGEEEGHKECCGKVTMRNWHIIVRLVSFTNNAISGKVTMRNWHFSKSFICVSKFAGGKVTMRNWHSTLATVSSLMEIECGKVTMRNWHSTPNSLTTISFNAWKGNYEELKAGCIPAKFLGGYIAIWLCRTLCKKQILLKHSFDYQRGKGQWPRSVCAADLFLKGESIRWSLRC